MAETVGQEVLAVVDLQIRQGSDCPFVLAFHEEDEAGATVVQSFTDWQVRSQIRNRVGGDVWLDLSEHMTLTDDTEGTLTVTGLIPHTVTEAVEWNARASKVVDGEVQPAGVWDVELVTAATAVIPLAAGRVFIDPDVTREA